MNHIKVQLDRESVWADSITKTTAVIDNLPLDPRVFYMDLVEIDKDNNFIKVIERKNRQAVIAYNSSDLVKDWPIFCKYMETENKIFTEGMMAGFVIIAFEKDRSEEEIENIINASNMNIENITFQPL